MKTWRNSLKFDRSGGRLIVSAMTLFLSLPAIFAGIPTQIEVRPASVLDFNRTNLSTPRPPIQKDVDVKNIGEENLTVTNAEIVSGDTTRFRLRDSFEEFELVPDATNDIDLLFDPPPTTPEGIYEAVLRITTNLPAPNDTVEVTLRGEVVLSSPGLPGSVVINEFCYDSSFLGVTYDYNNDGTASEQDDEFVEIYNVTNNAIDISGWSIDDNGRPSEDAFVFPSGTILPPKGFAIVFGGGTPTGFRVPAFAGMRRLGNDGDRIYLEDGFGDIDSVGYEMDASGTMNNLPGEANGGSFARELDGASTFVVRAPGEDVTPGRTNDLNAPPEGLLGDMDGDGDVRVDDLLAWIASRAADNPVGDFNGDQQTGGLDLFVLASNWMKSEG